VYVCLNKTIILFKQLLIIPVKSLIKDKVGKQKVYNGMANNGAAGTACFVEGDQSLVNRHPINRGN
jgi:hypothetical protein